MKEHIVKYYLPVFGITLAAILPALAKNYENENFKILVLILICISIILTIIIGTIYKKIENKILSKYKKRKLKNKTFEDFKSRGFKEFGDCIIARIEGYLILMSPEKNFISGEKWVEIRILFNPKISSMFIPQYVFEKLMKHKKSNFTWHTNMLTIKKKYGLKIPRYEKLYTLIKEGVSKLKENNIESISYDKWKELTEENIIYQKQTESLYS